MLLNLRLWLEALLPNAVYRHTQERAEKEAECEEYEYKGFI